MEVPTGSRNPPNRFSVQIHPRWDLRPPFSQKIFSENPNNFKKSFRSLSESKQEKKTRLKSDFSNLVKKILPGFRLFPDIILMDTTVCPPPSPVPCPPFRLFPDLILMDTIVWPPPSPVPCPPQQLTRGLRVIRNIARHIPRANNSTAFCPSPDLSLAYHSSSLRDCALFQPHPRVNNGIAWTLQFAPLSAPRGQLTLFVPPRRP